MKKNFLLSLFLLFFATICVGQPCSVQLSIDNPILCNGACGGVIEAQATGTGNLNYVWTPNISNNYYATDLCPGKYKVTMTDANNCMASDSVVLTQPDTLNVVSSVTNIKCGGDCSGKVSITVTGGTLPYQYSWNSGDTTKNLDSVCAGSYCLTVTDSAGCYYYTCDIVNSPDSLLIYLFPTQYGETGVTCYADTDGEIDSEVDGGTLPYKYHWSTNSTAESLYNLRAGTYVLTVTDSNKCTSIDTAILTQPPPYQITISTSNFNGWGVSCDSSTNGFICLSVSGETSPYSYYWSPIVSADSCIYNLGEDNYCFTVLDANGCELDSCVNINAPDPLVDYLLWDNPTSSTSYDGDITAYPFGGVPPYSYDWIPDVSNDSVATGLGNYTYTICIVDANGCSTCDTVILTSPLFIQNIADNLSASIVPNPSNGQLSIIFNATLYNTNIRIVNLLGQEVYNEGFSNISDKIDLDLKVPEGIYFVQVVNETGSWIGRFAIK